MSQESVLFLGRKNAANVIIHHSDKAIAFCQKHFKESTVHLGDWGSPLPDSLRNWKGDYIVSYLSRWVIPDVLLKKAKVAAINFHPGPPEYPGIGCTNFALYENASVFGATCHHMVSRVDSGNIIAVKRFSVSSSDNVASLLNKTYDCMYELFAEIMSSLLGGKRLPQSQEAWSRQAYSRKEFNELSKISPDMSSEEIARRVRATLFDKWKPTIEIGGFTFELVTKDGAASS